MYCHLWLLFIIDTISLRDLLVPFFLQYNMESLFCCLGCTGLFLRSFMSLSVKLNSIKIYIFQPTEVAVLEAFPEWIWRSLKMLKATYLLNLFILSDLKFLKFFSFVYFSYWIFYDKAFRWLLLAVDQPVHVLSMWFFLVMLLEFLFCHYMVL